MHRFFVAVVSLAALLSATPAWAELAFFATGRTLSIKSHRVEGDLVVLTLRAGGEMKLEAATIAKFEPDEVPYPEPAPPAVDRGADLPEVPFAELIEKTAKEQGVDVKLVRALIQVESAYKQRARSNKGAMGLMQLMPATARQYDVADPYDPKANIEAGIKHLKGLLERLPRVELALAAYNAGEAAVERFRGIPPYRETRDYVARIMQLLGR